MLDYAIHNHDRSETREFRLLLRDNKIVNLPYYIVTNAIMLIIHCNASQDVLLIFSFIAYVNVILCIVSLHETTIIT